MNTIIKPSSELRKNYRTVADLCKTSKSPVFITNNGEGDTVLMDMDTFHKREQDLGIAERLLEAKRARADGATGVSIEEFESSMKNAIAVGTGNGK